MTESQSSRGPVRWGFIGAGKMAGALIQGMLAKGAVTVDRVSASDPIGAIRDVVTSKNGIRVTESNTDVVERSDVIVLAVKPQSIANVLESLRPSLTKNHLLISIAAGISLKKLAEHHAPGMRVIRVMPNTPSLVGEGASAYAMGPEATEQDELLVKSCLEAVGLAFKVPESLIDAVTGLSGSGPAYVYTIIEALSDGGVRPRGGEDGSGNEGTHRRVERSSDQPWRNHHRRNPRTRTRKRPRSPHGRRPGFVQPVEGTRSLNGKRQEIRLVEESDLSAILEFR